MCAARPPQGYYDAALEPAFAVLAPASLAICALLALPCVRTVCWPLVEPPTHLLFRPPPERDGTSPGYSI